MPEVTLRRAGDEDLDRLATLASHPEVEPFLMPGAGETARLAGFLDLSGPEGLFVIESPPGTPVGALLLQVINHRSRIGALSGLMVAPAVRRSGVASAALRLACRRMLGEHGLHRVQAEVYGDNLPSQRLFERVGFTREGVRRKAYWRRDQWLDGVLYGILADELPQASPGTD